MLNGVMTTGEASKVFGYRREYLAQMCDEGKITADKSGGTWLLEVKSLKTYLTKQRDKKPKKKYAVGIYDQHPKG